MTFHPLIILPTDVRSARFFGGFFSTLVDDGLGFVDVGIGVCVVPTSGHESRILVCVIPETDAILLGFLASSVRLLFIGFRLTFAIGGMDQIGEFNKQFLLHHFNALFQLRGLEHRDHQLIVLRLQSLVLSHCPLQ